MTARLLLLLLIAVLPIVGRAQDVVLRPGEAYRIECAGVGQGGVVPGSVVDDPAVLLHVTTVPAASDYLWTIAESGTSADGTKAYTLRHCNTGLYATYDGQRNDNKRYVELTASTQGDASRWTLVDRGGTWSIENVKDPAHHWHTRSSNLTGTYADDVPPGANSRYSLVTAEGRKVTLLEVPAPDFHNLIGDLRFDGRRAVYDKKTSTYLVNLPEAMRHERSARLVVDYDASKGELEADDITVTAGRQHTFSEHTGGRIHKLALRTPDGDVYEARLAFTFLPIVELSGSFSPTTSGGSISVTDADNPVDEERLSVRVHWRGNTSLRRAKKSYAVKLVDESGKSIDRKLIGLRNDNNWILDAAAIDPSLMRNRVATDLWNSYSHKPYYKAEVKNERTGTRGHFVEVVLNGEYLGLYCMTEKMDRKQAKAMKQEKAADGTVIQHGSVYKSTEWKYETFMGHDLDDHTYPRRAPEEYESYNAMGAGTWRGWEIKYPDYESQPIDWGPLYNCVAFTATQGGTKFYEGFNTYWDIEQVKDYYLLLELLLATDNHGKNMFLINYDQQAATDAQRMAIGVWDLDGVFGIRWDGSTKITQPDQDFEKFLWANEHGTHMLFYRLKAVKNFNWANALAARYGKLRHGDFDPENLKRRFTDYFALISESGADAREAKRWGRTPFLYSYHDDMAGAVSYVCDWIDRRVAYLDEQYKYDPTIDPDILDDIDVPVVASDAIAVRPGYGELSVWADAPTVVSVYTTAGRLVTTRHLDAGVTTISPLAAGVYLVGGHKVVVK